MPRSIMPSSSFLSSASCIRSAMWRISSLTDATCCSAASIASSNSLSKSSISLLISYLVICISGFEHCGISWTKPRYPPCITSHEIDYVTSRLESRSAMLSSRLSSIPPPTCDVRGYVLSRDDHFAHRSKTFSALAPLFKAFSFGSLCVGWT